MSMVMRSACAWSASHMRHRDALSETLRALAPVYKSISVVCEVCVRPHACVSPWVRARARALSCGQVALMSQYKFTLVPCSQRSRREPPRDLRLVRRRVTLPKPGHKPGALVAAFWMCCAPESLARR